MNTFGLLILIPALCLAVCGCASKAKTQAQIRRAYAAGEQAAMAQMQQAQQVQQRSQTQQPIQQPGEETVRILGTVKNPLLTWSEGLTLAHALVEADYQNQKTPIAITIYRNNQPLSIDPQRLLDGEDYPLFPGDTVVIQN